MDPQYRKFMCDQPTDKNTHSDSKSNKQQTKVCENGGSEKEGIKLVYKIIFNY